MKGREAYPDEELRRRIMDFIMVAGQTLLENGAEVFRVEQTMEIMARSFHLREFHVYVLTNGIFASAGTAEISEVRNVPVRTTHLARVAAVNALSREIAETNMSLGEAEYRLAAAQRIPFPKDWVQLVSGMGGAFSFAMIFGGDLRSAIAAAVAGLAASGYLLLCGRYSLPGGFQKITTASLITLVCILHWYNPAVWMLAARAGRDIEEACDAETLHGRDAAYRAAYADALMTAVRRNCGPALTSGFALSKRQLKQRLTALWDTAPKHRGRILLAVLALTACCAGGLVACKPADAGPQDEQEPAAAAAPAPSETANPIVTPEPPPVSMEAGAAAVRRGADFLWSEYLTDGNGYYYHSGACGLVEPEDYDTEYISALLETRRDDGTTWRDYLNDGRGALVKATFEAELTPEGWYLGKQYGEGRFHVYLIAPFDESQPCEVISGWQSADDPNQSAHFEILPMARELDLTNNQYRMLLHQCNTLAQAGAQNFFNPGDWPQDELETYLYYRNQYFYDEADALLMLNLDFSDTTDWNRLPDYLTYDELNALDFSAPKTAAIPDYTPPESLESDDPGVWTFTREGLYITAEWPGVERYTFYVHNGNASLKFDARTICVQGQSLS